MSGHPQGAPYDDGYGQPQGQDSYYQDDQYAQYNDHQAAAPNGYSDQQNGDAYYDESCVPSKITFWNRQTDTAAVPIMTINSRVASISRTAIMTASKAIRTSITTISIMIREEPRQHQVVRTATGKFHPQCSHFLRLMLMQSKT